MNIVYCTIRLISYGLIVVPPVCIAVCCSVLQFVAVCCRVYVAPAGWVSGEFMVVPSETQQRTEEQARSREKREKSSLFSLQKGSLFYRKALSSIEGLSLLQKGSLFYRRAVSSTEELSLLQKGFSSTEELSLLALPSRAQNAQKSCLCLSLKSKRKAREERGRDKQKERGREKREGKGGERESV